MVTKKICEVLFTLVCTLALGWVSYVSADAEVTRSNNQWLARVNGSTVYQGSRYFDAVNAAANNMGAGTINIRNSGDSGPDGGNVYSIRPQSNQTLDFHGNQINANGGDLVVPVYCDKRNNITVRNLHVVGAPRYGIWFRGCSDIVLHNITMNLRHPGAVGLGIRVDGSTGAARNLTISGNININGSRGHAIETYSVDGFSIGDVTVTNSGGCGLLLNDSRNGTVGNVTGHHNNLGGGYATFRVANNNGPNVFVQSVHSRDSGRGFFSVSGSNGTTVNWVDIANTSSHGIFLEDASNTHVLGGYVSNGNPNCQLVRTSGSSLSVSGCSQVGTPPGGGSSSGGSGSSSSSSGGVSNGTINGTYRITPVVSGKAIDVDWCGTANGTNIHQWSWLDNDCQKFNISQVDGVWHRISPVVAGGQAIDIDSFSTENGANAMLWEYWGGSNQQFRFEVVRSGVWKIVNRNSNKCLDVYDFSTADGANIVQWDCVAGNNNQEFTLTRQ